MLYLCYLCRFKPLRDHLRGFLIAAWAGDKIAEFSFPEISFHFPLRPWFFFVSPAYAGKSHSYLNSTFLNLGSPPRMRGKGLHHRADRGGSGITPAYAGKSKRRALPALSPGDHPPHVRGKERSTACNAGAGGITPACAGKSTVRWVCQSPGWDHPRMCGEKASEYTCPLISLGSPPHVRGKACATSRRACAAGITPACAGKSLSGHTSKSGMKDHPRMCGEKTKKIP